MKTLMLLTAAVMTIGMGSAQADNKDDEIRPQLQKKYDRRLEEMKALDTNEDGVLQVEELKDKARNKFDTLDKNKDGIISEKERQAGINTFKKQKDETYGPFVDKKARKLENRYKNADANDDGQVSKEEYDAYFGKRYNTYDRDGDGIITEKEYRTDVEKLSYR